MKISLTEEIDKIKRLYTFLKGDTLLVEQVPKTNLPGPNYYEIQSFLEKKTDMDTGEPGFGEGHTEFGPYYYNTPLQEMLIKYIKIPTIDIGTNKNQIIFRPTVPKKKQTGSNFKPIRRATTNPIQNKINKK